MMKTADMRSLQEPYKVDACAIWAVPWMTDAHIH